MASDATPPVMPALRALHRRLFIEAKAEYDAALTLEAQREESPVRATLVDAGASLRSIFPRMLGGRSCPRAEGMSAELDPRGWSRVFTSLANLQRDIDLNAERAALDSLHACAEALLAEKRRTRATLDRIESGGEACIAELEIIVGACVTIASAGVGANAAAAGASLLKVAGLSAATAAAARTTFSAAKVASERVEGIDDDAWLSTILDGAEDGVTTLVFAVVGGKLSARFVPKLARYLGAYVPETFLVRVGQILHLRGAVPRDFFVTTGSRVLWDFLSGSASAVLAAPIHVVFETLRGHRTSIESFLDAVAQQVVTGGAFQVLMAGLTNALLRKPVGNVGGSHGEAEQFHDLLGNQGLATPELSLQGQLRLYRSDAELGPMLSGVSDEEVMAVIGYTGPDHDLINTALRTGDKQLRAALRPYIELCKRGMKVMPKHEGTVWRGVKRMSPAGLAKYTVGAVVADEGFVSTTSREDNVFMGQVQMEIMSKTGRDISGISLHRFEREVLFAPGSKFRVLEREDQAGFTRLKLQEEVHP